MIRQSFAAACALVLASAHTAQGEAGKATAVGRAISVIAVAVPEGANVDVDFDYFGNTGVSDDSIDESGSGEATTSAPFEIDEVLAVPLTTSARSGPAEGFAEAMLDFEALIRVTNLGPGPADLTLTLDWALEVRNAMPCPGNSAGAIASVYLGQGFENTTELFSTFRSRIARNPGETVDAGVFTHAFTLGPGARADFWFESGGEANAGAHGADPKEVPPPECLP